MILRNPQALYILRPLEKFENSIKKTHFLVYTKTVDSVFHALSLAAQSRNILH